MSGRFSLGFWLEALVSPRSTRRPAPPGPLREGGEEQASPLPACPAEEDNRGQRCVRDRLAAALGDCTALSLPSPARPRGQPLERSLERQSWASQRREILGAPAARSAVGEKKNPACRSDLARPCKADFAPGFNFASTGHERRASTGGCSLNRPEGGRERRDCVAPAGWFPSPGD